MQVKSSLFWGIVLFSRIGWSQTCNKCIYVDKYAGCVPLTVNVADCGNGKIPSYDYGESKIPIYVGLTRHTYNSVGTYYITQKADYHCGTVIGADTTVSGPVKVLPLPPPNMSAFPCSGGMALVTSIDSQYDTTFVTNGTEIPVPKLQSVFLSFTDTISKTLATRGEYAGLHCGGKGTLFVQTYTTLKAPQVNSVTVTSSTQVSLNFIAEKHHRYEIRMRTGFSGSFLAIDTLDGQIGTIVYNVNNLNTQLNNYCFEVRAFDYCGQSKVSGDFCTVILSGTAQNKQNVLNWSNYPGITSSSYILLVNGQASTSFSSRPNALSFTDTNIICGQTYCYQIQTPLSGGISSFSNSVCLTAVSNAIPPAVQNIQTTVTGNQVVVSWTASAAGPSAYSVYSSKSSSGFTFLGNASSNTYTSTQQDPSQASYCYKVDYKDNCGNQAPISGTTCPVYLTGTVYSPISRSLSWTSYIVWAEGLKEYFLEKVDVNGVPYTSKSVGTKLTYVDSVLDTTQQILYFRIRAVSNTGKESYSNIFKAIQESEIFKPNAFTPNGDGLNDVFHFEGLFISEFNLEIWNRNGEGMFSSKSIHQGWDGTVNGHKAPADVYMYKLEVTDKSGKVYKPISGTVQLIR
jgi:gliding motility-associated-like protein